MTRTIADAIPFPPDNHGSIYLGPVLGPVVWVALCAAAITFGYWIRHRGVSKRIAIFLSVLFLVLANLAIYLIDAEVQKEENQRWYDDQRRNRKPRKSWTSETITPERHPDAALPTAPAPPPAR